MKKRLLFFFVGLVCSLVANAAAVKDLVAIDKNWTFIADDITSNGTVGLTANTLYCDGFIFAPTANSKATNKGKSTFGGAEHLNSLRLKNTQDQLVLKVAGACKITFYTQSVSNRGINAGTTAGGTDLGVQPASTPVWELNISEAKTIYLSSYNGDFFFAGFVVSGFATADKAPTISVPATYTGDTKHAINVKATVDGSPEPAIQWYSNTTNSTTGGSAIEGATGATYQFAPSVAGTYYFYATAENKVGKATSGVTTVTVDQAYQATFSKGEAIGTAPSVIYTAADGKLAVPTNYSLFVEGKTLASWTDGTNTYEPGKQYTISADIALTPNFVVNTESLENLAGTTTVSFINSNSTAVTYQTSEKNAIVEKVNVGGQAIDVAIIVKDGKFDLQPAGPRAQTNQNTKVSIPVINGAIVKINIYDNKDVRTYDATINGEAVTPYLGEESGKQSLMTYTYNGAAGYIDYVVNGSNMYAYCIDVTYPGKFESTTPFSMKTAATGNVSIEASADHIALPEAANLTINGGSVTVSNGQSSAKNLFTTDGFAMTNGNTFFTVTLDEALKAGDVITATMSQAGRGLVFSTNDAYSDKYPGGAADDVNFSYTVTEEDGICGETTFNVFRATSNSTYFNNFAITRPATVLTVNVTPTVGYATFYSDVETRMPAGTKAYTATYNADRSTITLNEIEGKIIPAETAVVIEGEGGDFLYSNTGAAAIADNDLKGTLEDIATSSIAGGTVCVLGYENEKAGFYKFNGAILAANKAYLVVPASAPAKINIVKNGEAATGITTVNAQAKNGVMYNLAGQRVNADAKGMVIVNGKVVIKK